MRGEYEAEAGEQHCPSVHPHMRGEYNTLRFVASAIDGSSPHAWRI